MNEGKLPTELGQLSIFWKLSLIYRQGSNFDTVLWQKRCNLYTEKKNLILEPKSCGQLDHPLSLQTNSTWKSHFDVGELKRTISQDVTRTFPDIDFYRSEEIQSHMRDVLLVYSKFVSKFSYRQGTVKSNL